ncbi:MAG: glycosyltransferase family 4 protein [Rhodospirillales bacterium]|jgi:glycosyltransferase involved in cell wall biosynthesis|nr:glycosyltransferase family 4 protein [Rhodospirillales bacterium]
MARIVLADDGIRFDGTTLATRPLGGVETSVILLVRELARLGHEVLVRNKCERPLRHEGVEWAPIGDGMPDQADLYIANRGDGLLPLMPKARRTVFWVHNPARYLLKWRYLSKLWSLRPAIVFLGAYHAGTYPRWAPDGGRVVIPYGIADEFLVAEPDPPPPPPRAVFTSNPLRSLDWLLDLWVKRIQPEVPDAELHLFSGAATYGGVGAAKAAEMEAVLKHARALARSGVVLRDPLPKAGLIEELRAARAMLYRGDVNETFCLAVGEAQAMGVPAVVQDLGSVGERVSDNETGFVTPDAASFARAAVRLLSDDDLWRRQHRAALKGRSGLGWGRAARAFEELIP